MKSSEKAGMSCTVVDSISLFPFAMVVDSSSCRKLNTQRTVPYCVAILIKIYETPCGATALILGGQSLSQLATRGDCGSRIQFDQGLGDLCG
jgi:hypothetical protein